MSKYFGVMGRCDGFLFEILTCFLMLTIAIIIFFRESSKTFTQFMGFDKLQQP